jgi:hypothetical protein
MKCDNHLHLWLVECLIASGGVEAKTKVMIESRQDIAILLSIIPAQNLCCVSCLEIFPSSSRRKLSSRPDPVSLRCSIPWLRKINMKIRLWNASAAKFGRSVAAACGLTTM